MSDRNETLTKFIYPVIVYTVTVILVASMFYFGYKLWFLAKIPEQHVILVKTYNSQQLVDEQNSEKVYIQKEQWEQMLELLGKVNKSEEYKHNDCISVDMLNGFYASLFASITIIIALLGIFGWKSMIETKIKLNKLTDIDDKVSFLHKKKDFTRWAQDKFTSEDIESSYELDLTTEDKKTLNEMETYLKDEHEDNAWLEMVIAHELIFQKDDIDEAEKIYKFIEARNIFPDNSKVEPILYHLLGQLYKKRYDYFVAIDTDIDKAQEILLKSERYYNKSLEVRKEKEKTRTNSNLAVVYIELGKQELRKYYKNPSDNDSSNAFKYFNKAMDKLKKVEKQDPAFQYVLGSSTCAILFK